MMARQVKATDIVKNFDWHPVAEDLLAILRRA